jgi:two-component system cell cycle response regulator
MTSRVLVADDHEPNRRLLQARLESESFDVVLAEDGVEAVEAAIAHLPDLILMDIMMPRMDGFEATRAIKADPRTRHIPVVMVTALSQQADRVRGLQAGADDFLTKPIDDVILFARVRSVLRLKQSLDELHSRRRNERPAGAPQAGDAPQDIDVSDDARILLIADPGCSARPVERLVVEHRVRVETDPARALRLAQGPWDLMIVDLAAETFDGLRLAERLKADEATRRLPILAFVDARDRDRLVRALDCGVNDVLATTADSQELDARVRALVRRKRYADHLRASLEPSPYLAANDPLTGLRNRAALSAELAVLVQRCRADGVPLSVVMIGADHLAPISEAYGREVGDQVFRALAERLAGERRATDVAGRYGAEELAVIMPDSDIDAARDFAERMRRAAGEEPIRIDQDKSVVVTVSLGVSRLEPDDDVARLLDRVEQALDAAKRRGRNRVIVARLKRPNEAA